MGLRRDESRLYLLGDTGYRVPFFVVPGDDALPAHGVNCLFRTVETVLLRRTLTWLRRMVT